MHYIRFLKTPRLDASRRLVSKITVTTDLGESFLYTDITLVAYLQYDSGIVLQKEVLWNGSMGMRDLEVVLHIPPKLPTSRSYRVVIKPKDPQYSIDSYGVVFEDASEDLDADNGRVVTVRSMPLDLKPGSANHMPMIERVFTLRKPEQNNVSVIISEETGESIARHIWDAGLVFSSYISSLFSPDTDSTTRQSIISLPKFEERVCSQDLRVLELGAGCGIVGLTLAMSRPSFPHLILTDLEEAQEILEVNIEHHFPNRPFPNLLRHPRQSSRRVVTRYDLDWSASHNGVIAEIPFNLILVADCTYNPDQVPWLVKTLRSFVKGSCQEALVCIAMKVRHESEKIFFDLMQDNHFVVLEKGSIRLPVLGDEDQAIEIYIFESKE